MLTPRVLCIRGSSLSFTFHGETSRSSNTLPFEASKDRSMIWRGCSTSVDCISPTDEVNASLDSLSDNAILSQLESKAIAHYQLEFKLKDLSRAVALRRKFLGLKLDRVPYNDYEWEKVRGANCENVVGYVPIPVGVAGPVLLEGKEVYIPMATTEGCLVASTHRGLKAIHTSGGATAVVVGSGMTRAPVVRLPTLLKAAELKAWIDDPVNFAEIQKTFNSTTRFGKLKSLQCCVSGRTVYLRFCATSGDAMGMNMVSKGTEAALELFEKHFPEIDVLSLAGNYCTDKKASAVNWICGRGRTVVADAVIKKEVVESLLKTTVDEMVKLNNSKNLVGSAVAGALGGFNAHAANTVTAVYIATGQDPAQNVESSSCLTQMEEVEGTGDLYISVYMPSMEVGTVGGGTGLPTQRNLLEMMGCAGASVTSPGENADQLAKLIAVGVMGGEISLLAAQAAGHLVKSHMRLNRKTTE